MSAYNTPGSRERIPGNKFVWLVLSGDNAEQEATIRAALPPTEEEARRILEIPDDVPILIGTP